MICVLLLSPTPGRKLLAGGDRGPGFTFESLQSGRPGRLHAVSARAGSTELGNAPAAQFLTRSQLGIFPKGTARRQYPPRDNRKFTGGPCLKGVTAGPVRTSLPSGRDVPTPPAGPETRGRAAGEPGCPDPAASPWARRRREQEGRLRERPGRSGPRKWRQPRGR